eukprot:2279067-Rhodomonas_salina.1
MASFREPEPAGQNLPFEAEDSVFRHGRQPAVPSTPSLDPLPYLPTGHMPHSPVAISSALRFGPSSVSQYSPSSHSTHSKAPGLACAFPGHCSGGLLPPSQR